MESVRPRSGTRDPASRLAERRSGHEQTRATRLEVKMKLSRLLLVVFVLSFWRTVATGADADPRASALVEAAKKEGKMVFYTSVETEFARSLTSAFEARYPFIKTDIFRST